ncbi:MAG: DUF2270 domain-containing protein [Halosimplex sp.]
MTRDGRDGDGREGGRAENDYPGEPDAGDAASGPREPSEPRERSSDEGAARETDDGFGRRPDDEWPTDPRAPAARDVGRGLFEESMPPSSSMAHLYRGEVHRMTRWRERLDRTTNWAVTVIAAILTWAFTSPDNPHYLVLIGFVALLIFLGIEAHRYRGFDVWRHRVRLIQENVWAHGLDPSGDVVDPDWRAELADDYRTPTVKIPFEEALAHRLRRIYLPLGTVVLGAWAIRVTAFAAGITWPASAAVGMIPGPVVTGVVAVVYVAGVAVAFRPRQWHSESELRTEDIGAWEAD